MNENPFERLFPALQYHIVNSMGWSSLRPTQQQAISPILDGKDCIILAPTAGGKTEAAFIPILSRMAAEQWPGVSVIYVCPIKALLNNLEERLTRYCSFIGRRVQVWHGDINQSQKRNAMKDYPDVILTTPESLEAMLISLKVERKAWFGNVRAFVVDELHAFAGDDRGWHLRSVMSRVERYANKPVQRVGLSATLGNPDELLEWFASGVSREIVGSSSVSTDADVMVDHVGSLENAAIVISRLHRGEKRLVFCDSRSKVEQLAVLLRGYGTRTFVSHASLSASERKLAETAFAEEKDCVIVATSTLELGIDVGDLDRVLQIDSPGTVSSFLQRMGRTGRRPGSARNCTFLCTTEESLIVALGVCRLWSEQWVEPVVAPGDPWHIVAQQAMTLCLERSQIPERELSAELGLLFRELSLARIQELVRHMVSTGFLHSDEGGLSVGGRTEELYGRSNYLDLLSSFTTPKLLLARHGGAELGYVDPMNLPKSQEDKVLLLGGRSWKVMSVDWPKQIVWVEPSTLVGKARWMGASRSLGRPLCKAILRALRDEGTCVAKLSKRSQETIDELNAAIPEALRQGRETAIEHLFESGRYRWWTFAGGAANSVLVAWLQANDTTTKATDMWIEVDDLQAIKALAADEHDGSCFAQLFDRLMVGLKFHEALPRSFAEDVLEARYLDLATAHLLRLE